MTRAVLVTLGLIASLVATHAQRPQVFRAETDLTHFGVTVTDRRGSVVSGLTADDFEVVEDGSQQTIRFFAQGTDQKAPELHAGLMLDTSESMIDDLDLSRTAAIKFLNRLPEARDLTLVDFDSQVRVGRFSQDDFPRLVERIRSRKGEGMTALYDAFILYLDGATENPGRSVLVAFTDGGDSRSRTDFGDVVDMVRASSNVTIYVVGLLEHQSPQARNEQRLRLTRIADESGGQAIFPNSMKEVEAAYDRIVNELRAQYSLGYVSTNTRNDGRWRNVKIKVTRDDLKDVRVRTRGGYFAPDGSHP
ncbi:MAG TPA: VWA domain-containing protein [Vicinamibacterales bacterium]|nr:VWA domain-containing protein [Vicinamibacterales bacterium]